MRWLKRVKAKKAANSTGNFPVFITGKRYVRLLTGVVIVAEIAARHQGPKEMSREKLKNMGDLAGSLQRKIENLVDVAMDRINKAGDKSVQVIGKINDLAQSLEDGAREAEEVLAQLEGGNGPSPLAPSLMLGHGILTQPASLGQKTSVDGASEAVTMKNYEDRQFKESASANQFFVSDPKTHVSVNFGHSVAEALKNKYWVQATAGPTLIENGDWVVRDKLGKTYVLSDAAFRASYEPVAT